MQKVFTAVYEKRERWFIGYVEEIPGVNSQGKTLKEVKKNLKEALALILETNRILADSELRSTKAIREPIAVNQ